MATGIEEIEGIGETYAQKLKQNSIASVESLLEKGATSQGRKSISESTAISETLILKWVNHADLMRINGVAGEYAELLEAAGVDTVVELSKRVPENLTTKMTEINAQKNLVRRIPTGKEVTNWVSQAKTLSHVVTH